MKYTTLVNKENRIKDNYYKYCKLIDTKNELNEEIKIEEEAYNNFLLLKNYLKELTNVKELVYPYLQLDYSLDIFERIMKKYSLEPSNHLVDIIYEAIIYEGNNKE